MNMSELSLGELQELNSVLSVLSEHNVENVVAYKAGVYGQKVFVTVPASEGGVLLYGLLSGLRAKFRNEREYVVDIVFHEYGYSSCYVLYECEVFIFESSIGGVREEAERKLLSRPGSGLLLQNQKCEKSAKKRAKKGQKLVVDCRSLTRYTGSVKKVNLKICGSN